ncbi:MAG: hypothetical protein R3B47_06535 [Bacteroidia bacterium]
MKRVILLLFSLTPLLLLAQNNLSLGLRAGLTPGFTARWQASETLDGELLWSFRQGGTQLTGMVSREIPISAGDLHVYYGGGGHLGYYRDRVTVDENDVPFRKTHLSVGIDLLGGVAYDIPQTPLTIAVDYKPYVDLFYWKNFSRNLGDVGISLSWRFGSKQNAGMMGDF